MEKKQMVRGLSPLVPFGGYQMPIYCLDGMLRLREVGESIHIIRCWDFMLTRLYTVGN